MDSIDPEEHRRVDRRTFLKGGLLAGGVIAGAGLAIRATADTDPATPPAAHAGRAGRAADRQRERTGEHAGVPTSS